MFTRRQLYQQGAPIGLKWSFRRWKSPRLMAHGRRRRHPSQSPLSALRFSGASQRRLDAEAGVLAAELGEVRLDHLLDELVEGPWAGSSRAAVLALAGSR